MKVIIAGSRSIVNFVTVQCATAASDFKITEVVSGGARGVDILGERWAKEHRVPVRRFRADWKHYGRSAGYRRNVQMGEYADALIAVWDGKSPGTKHMMDIMRKLKKEVYVEEPA